jgi:MFS family permease
MARARTPLTGLIIAYLISGIGTAMSTVAVPWLVLTTTGSATATGVVGFAQMTPYVLLQATAGPLVDRIGLRRAFLIGNTAAALAMGAVPVLHGLGGLRLGVFAALVALAGAVRGIADCATTPLLPAYAKLGGVANERAIGLYSSANRAAMLMGLPLAGVLIAVIGPADVVVIDAASFAAAVLILALSARHPARPAPAERKQMSLRTYACELAEGLAFLRADRLLLGIVTLVALTNLLDEALTSVLLPVWAHDRVHRAEALGLVGGGWGLGLMIGALGGAWLGPKLPRWAMVSAGMLLSASPPFFALAASTSVPFLLAVFVTTGVLGGVLNPILGAVEIERVPPQLQARVLGAIKASAWIGVPFGSLVGGTLAGGPGLTAALGICGAAMLLVTLAPLVFPVWRGLDHAPAPAPGELAPAGSPSGLAFPDHPHQQHD